LLRSTGRLWAAAKLALSCDLVVARAGRLPSRVKLGIMPGRWLQRLANIGRTAMEMIDR
jgi:hypothetical protein